MNAAIGLFFCCAIISRATGHELFHRKNRTSEYSSPKAVSSDSQSRVRNPSRRSEDTSANDLAKTVSAATFEDKSTSSLNVDLLASQIFNVSSPGAYLPIWNNSRVTQLNRQNVRMHTQSKKKPSVTTEDLSFGGFAVLRKPGVYFIHFSNDATTEKKDFFDTFGQNLGSSAW